MEFKLTINNTELRKLIKLFNTKYRDITYNIDAQQRSLDGVAKISVSCPEENDELIEDIMEEFDTVNIELVIKNEFHNRKIKSVIIFSNGQVEVLDENNNEVKELQGHWHDHFKDILILVNNSTSFTDNRPK